VAEAEGRGVTGCEACGADCPESAAYCGACGHRLGRQPEERVVVNVRVVNSWWDGCIGCLSWAVAVVVIIALIGWIFSC
jgi:ferredoxin